MTTFSQGLAWIDSETYQITRLRSDLLKPVQELNLQRETTEIAYGEAHFKDKAAVLSGSPQQVTVTVDWRDADTSVTSIATRELETLPRGRHRESRRA